MVACAHVFWINSLSGSAGWQAVSHPMDKRTSFGKRHKMPDFHVPVTLCPRSSCVHANKKTAAGGLPTGTGEAAQGLSDRGLGKGPKRQRKVGSAQLSRSAVAGAKTGKARPGERDRKQNRLLPPNWGEKGFPIIRS